MGKMKRISSKAIVPDSWLSLDQDPDTGMYLVIRCYPDNPARYDILFEAEDIYETISWMVNHREFKVLD